MFSIQIISNTTGKPIKGKKVRVGFDGLRGMTDEEFSDENGEVHFNSDPGNGEVYVDHNTVFKGRIQGRVRIYI
jgi:uncharacterized GH25 family protein